MQTETTSLIGQQIKTGRTGPKPEAHEVMWIGTAEINCFESARVPAALVRTDRGAIAVVRLAGCDLEQDAWWDARCLSSREWETESGDLVGDVDPGIAGQIDAFLASATGRHDQARKDLHSRIMLGTYRIA
jgi:hypothetical protein